MRRRDLNKYNKLVKEYDEHPLVQSMKTYVQHGTTTTYDHSVRVAKLSYLLNTKLRLHADEQILVPAAFLHDFFLYDWHDEPKVSVRNFTAMHGFTHPKKAADNAKEVFDINDETYDAISSHMWPLTITKVPKSKEAKILCAADKMVALKETFEKNRFFHKKG